MPCLPNPKQELYAKHRANNFIPKKAAVAAGYATGSAIYTELENDPDVQQRIQELMDERAAKKEALRVAATEAGKIAGEITGVTHGWVISQLKNVSELALDAGDFKEAKEAAVKIGEHLGMFGKQGGGGEGGSGGTGEGGHVIDLDMVERLTHQTDHLQPAKNITPKEVDPAMVQSLIEGQGGDMFANIPEPSNRVAPGARELSTGSEADVAMRQED